MEFKMVNGFLAGVLARARNASESPAARARLAKRAKTLYAICQSVFKLFVEILPLLGGWNDFRLRRLHSWVQKFILFLEREL